MAKNGLASRCPTLVLAIGLLAAGTLTGCAWLRRHEPPPFAGPEAPFVRSDLEPAAYFGLAWPQPDLIVLGDSVKPGAPYNDTYEEARLFGVAPDGAKRRRLRLDRAEDCWNWNVQFPFALADGRLGYLETCSRMPVEELWKKLSTFRAMDLSAGGIETLGEVYRTDPEIPNGPVSIARDPIHGRRGLVAASAYLCTNLYWLDGDGIEFIDVRIDGFDPSDMFRPGRRPVTGCAELPTWSPDGASLALIADPDAVTNGDFQSIREDWSLYLANDDLSEPLRVDGPWGGAPWTCLDAGQQGTRAGDDR